MSSENENIDSGMKNPYRANKGLINGNGFTNGLGAKTATLNGNGLINGNGLTNGNGMSDRKYTRIPLIESKRFKRRILGVVLAFALIIAPLFVYLIEFGDTPSGMIIDGNFSDWEDKDGYGDSAEDATSNPNINIVEYKMLKNKNDVHFYLEVQGDMLKGTNTKTDSVHIFIDSDTDPATGYSVEGIGADYMLEAQGKSGRILSSDLNIFDPDYRTVDGATREQNDWNGWTELQSGELKCVSNKLEARVPLYDQKGSSAATSDHVFACMRLADGNGNEDYSDTIVSTDKGALIVTETPLVNGVASEERTEVLELEFTAVDKDVTITSINFEHNGGGKLNTLPMPLTITHGSTVSYSVILDTTNAAYGDYATVKVSTITTRDNVPVTLSGVGASTYIKAVPKVIKIDGVFADWDNIAGGVDSALEETLNGNTNIDLVEHRNINQNNKLSFYLKVDGTMMEGSKVLTRPMVWERPTEAPSDDSKAIYTDINPELMPLPEQVGKDEAYIFLDTDNDPLSGYLTEDMDIGAEYMIMITGHDGTILSRTLYLFSEDGSWLASGTEVLAATDATQLEAQVMLGALGFDFQNGIGIYYMMTDWNGNKDSSEQPISISVTEPVSMVNSAGYGLRSNKFNIDYTNFIIDAVWGGIPNQAGGGEGSIDDPTNDVPGNTPDDIEFCKVCDNGSWINFYVGMQNLALPIPANVVIYIDANKNSTADYALIFDISWGVMLYNWSGFWNLSKAVPEVNLGLGEIEMGINLSWIGSPTNISYNVSTQLGTPGQDVPGQGTSIDDAPNLGTQWYTTNVPEFQLLLIPVTTVFLIILLIRRKRRNITIVKKEVSL